MEVSSCHYAQWVTDGRALCTAAGNQAPATVVADGAGGAIVTWSDYRSGDRSDIYAQHGAEDPHGRWMAARCAQPRMTNDLP